MGSGRVQSAGVGQELPIVVKINELRMSLENPKKNELFADLVACIDSWSDAATKALTSDDDDATIWVDRRLAFAKLRAALVSHGVPAAVVQEVLTECFEGIAHSFLCILDGATALSDTGRIYAVDEDGCSLGDGLHEDFVDYLFNQDRS